MINIIKDVEILDEIPNYDVILVGTNVYCTLGQHGVQRDIALHYPYADEDNKKTRYADVDKLGTMLVSERENEPIIALLYIVRGYPKRKTPDEDWLNYEALTKCLKLANVRFKDKKVACAMLGCSRFDGNGDKEKVIKIINDTITNFDLTIYDYLQKTNNEKKAEIYHYEQKVKKEEGYEAYYKLVRERKKKEAETLKRNGHARY